MPKHIDKEENQINTIFSTPKPVGTVKYPHRLHYLY